jgi:TPR repeat protein
MTRKTLAVLAFSLLHAACAGTAPTTPASKTGQPAKQADDFLVVDCLLPGQIRQLGTSVTYQSARRAVKTSASDCRIRGGEYVAFDPANYATALRVWMPRAEQGDPEAQTNVGEIYEKGRPADYKAAAEWYRKAAEKNYSRAAINLGNLYDQGLGVPKDSVQALNWYRRAAGLKELALGTDAQALERERALRRQLEDRDRDVESLRRDLQSKQSQLDRVQKELEDARRQRDQRRNEIDADRARLAEDRKKLQEERSKPQESQQRQQEAAAGRVKDLERAIADAQTRLATKEKELADARAAAGKSETALKREQTAVAEAAEQRAKLDGLRRDLAQVQTEAQVSRARVTELERSILERESRLAAKDREMAELRVKVTKLEDDAKARERVVVETRQKAAGAAPEIQLIEPEILATRDTTPSVQASRGELTVVGKVISARGLLSLTVDGREQVVDSSNIFKSKLAVAAPDQRVRLVAIDRDGRKSTLDFMIRERAGGKAGAVSLAHGSGVGQPLPRDKKIPFGNYHALVIGNNDYQKLPKLKTAVEDARDVGRILEKDYGFKVRVLQNATRYDTLSALNDMRAKLTAEDNFLVYYAGHGELDEKNQRGHWLPVDAEPESTTNWISNVQITDILNAMNVRQLLVVADSCYAGTLTRSAITQLAGGITEEDRMKAIELMAKSRSRMVMTSGGVKPVLDSGGTGKHSVFAQSFLEFLQQNDGVLTGHAMFGLLRDKIVALAGRVEHEQVPEYAPLKLAGHESGDFLFVRRAN